jgi:hypothetical protein
MIEIIGNIVIKEEKNPIVVNNERINSAFSNFNPASGYGGISSVVNKKKEVNLDPVSDYYVGSTPSNGLKFDTPYIIEIYTSYSPDKIKLSFDDYNDIYPTEVTVTKLEAYIPAVGGEVTETTEFLYFPFMESEEDISPKFKVWTMYAQLDVAKQITKNTTGINVIIPEYKPEGVLFRFDDFYLATKGGVYNIFSESSFDFAKEQGSLSYTLSIPIGNSEYTLEFTLIYVPQIGNQPSHFVLSVSGFDGNTEYYFYSQRTKQITSGGTPERYENLLDTPIAFDVDSPVVMLEGLSKYGKTTNDGIFRNYTRIELQISEMNMADVALTITGIYFNAPKLNCEINKNNLISIDRSIFDRSDLKLPNWGILSNKGNIEFNDKNGKIRQYAESLFLQSGLKCEIKLKNTLVDGATETIGLFETDQWDYDNDNRIASVTIKDDLEEWQDIEVEGINYDPRDLTHRPFSLVYKYLWNVTSNRTYNGVKGNGNYNMLALEELDEDTQKILNNTYTQYYFLKSGSLWQQWSKLCQACQLYIYKNNNGVVVCRYNGGN